MDFDVDVDEMLHHILQLQQESSKRYRRIVRLTLTDHGHQLIEQVPDFIFDYYKTILAKLMLQQLKKFHEIIAHEIENENENESESEENSFS
ncbi:hypothetical protein [Texcoconibacillus texcoconensis]|uniref:DNA-binding MarR family transcriptional regulator n=1 Tax=Texcoconibacillus texcoconensis TaxID=1095777 RepID=A0A840QRA1_9BACI|nr:hypothetical protein [Texcoconibacillus texcoconensis]MBB5173851.1 DNA-binding MarR family transcriptional regulator [Texcoconibacillus texcoconensis]